MLKMINRSAVILRAKPEFEQWLANAKVFASMPPEMQELLKQISLEDIRANGTVIFIPLVQNNTLGESAEFIKNNADKILEQVFARWGISSAHKPAKPALEILSVWFDLTHHTNVFTIMD